MPRSPLEHIGDSVRKRYEGDRRLLTFEQFTTQFAADPYLLCRNAVQYLRDAIEWFGSYEVPGIGGPVTRWRLFDAESQGGEGAVVGQEEAQRAIVEAVSAAAREGRLDRMLVLHGPNGSGKSSLVEMLQLGLEVYSHQPEGAIYALRWIFPKLRPEAASLGFGKSSRGEEPESFALLDPDDVAGRIICELKDNPLFMIPDSERAAVLADALERHPQRRSESFRTFLMGNLSPKSKTIYESLLAAYKGDWRKVVRHVQVERIFISRRFRIGAVVTQPQGTADAALRPLTAEGPPAGLPAFLQSVPLYEVVGDLPDANRGMLEFSDFLKRNPEYFKYLLTTTEKGFVSVANQLIELDIVFVATANERHLDEFKRYQEFASFQGRMTFIRVPYLREVDKEAEIYRRICTDIGRTHAVAPHIPEALALFAILTRLERPQKEAYEGVVAELVDDLDPVEKAWLYTRGTAPDRLDPSEIRELERELPAIRDEFRRATVYEGRIGASVRDLRTVLNRAAASSPTGCVGPRDLERELTALIRETDVYRFLQVEAQKDYHDAAKLAEHTLHQLGEWLVEDVQKAMSLVPETEYERRLERYVKHLVAHARKESVRDPSTGRSESPDVGFLESVESELPVHGPVDAYRQSLLSRLAAYAMENPKEQPPRLGAVFPDLLRTLRRRYHDVRRESVLRAMRAMLLLDTEDAGSVPEADRKDARRTRETLIRDLGYPEGCFNDVLGFALEHLGSERP